MFWTAVLPFQITAWICVVLVILVSIWAVNSKRPFLKTSLISFAVIIVCFVPSRVGVSIVVDQYKFGHFEHDSFTDVKDFRIERYLPTNAKKISLYKSFGGNGYRAKYEIPGDQLESYLDDLWDQFGKYSALPRSQSTEQTADSFDLSEFSKFDVILTGKISIYLSPTEADGGGARYYYCPESGVALQSASYWQVEMIAS